jgi:hypothetical protein
MNEIRYSLELPPVEKVHEVIFSFMRTSDCGEWRSDPEHVSDPFLMHFCRGVQRRGFFGLGSGFTEAHTPPQDVFMRLKLSVRPSPSCIRIGLTYTFDRYPPSNFAKTNRMGFQRCCEYTRREAESLARYLRDCFELPELPTLTD